MRFMKPCRMALAALVFSFFLATGSHAQNFLWAGRVGGIGSDRCNALAYDASGNVYIIGNFAGTADFNPGAGVANLTASGTYDIFIAKYNSAGDYVWAKRLGGSGEDAGNAIAVDGSGNVFIAGSFTGTADFSLGTGTAINKTATGMYDAFVAKYDGNGNHIWSYNGGGIHGDLVSNLVLDASGNVYVSGIMASDMNFDPAGAAPSLNIADGALFMVKYTNSGSYVWGKNMAASGGTLNVNVMTLDTKGNIYIAGTFTGTQDFYPGSGTANLSSIGYQDIFMGKYDNNGNYKWAYHMGCPVNVNTPHGMAIDPFGNVNLTGNFYNTVDFDPGPATANLTTTGNYNIFIAQYDSLGKYKWAKGLGGTSGGSINSGTSLCTDASGNLYVGGQSAVSVDFDPGAGVANLTSKLADIFLAKYDNSGNYKWAKSFPAAHGVVFNPGVVDAHIALTPTGTMYVAGTFADTTDFGLGAPNASRISAGLYDGYIAKYGTSTGISNGVFSEPSVQLYPNPASGNVSIRYSLEAAATVSIMVYDIQGKTAAALPSLKQSAGSHEQVLHIADYSLSPGVYMVMLKTNEGAVTRRLVIENAK